MEIKSGPGFQGRQGDIFSSPSIMVTNPVIIWLIKISIITYLAWVPGMDQDLL